MHYEICWVGEDGLYGCGHEHPSVADAASHMVPDSGSFLRAFESGAYRSLNDREFIDFLEAIDRSLDYENWFIQEVEKGLAQDAPGELIEHEEVVARIEKRLKEKQTRS